MEPITGRRAFMVESSNENGPGGQQQVILDLVYLQPGDKTVEKAGGREMLQGLVGGLIADAVKAYREADNGYRNFRAIVVTDVLAKDPKSPEWKAKAAVESHADFLRHKDWLANLEANYEYLVRYYAALCGGGEERSLRPAG